MSAQASDAVLAWERFAAWAAIKGWTVELTPAGRSKCTSTKHSSVVFGPGCGSDYRELVGRLGYIDGLMSRYRRGGS